MRIEERIDVVLEAIEQNVADSTVVLDTEAVRRLLLFIKDGVPRGNDSALWKRRSDVAQALIATGRAITIRAPAIEAQPSPPERP